MLSPCFDFIEQACLKKERPDFFVLIIFPLFKPKGIFFH